MPRDLKQPTAEGRPLRVMFIITSMPVGGAEMLLVNLVRRMDRRRFLPSVCCLKSPGPLGEVLAKEIPLYHDLIRHKYDVGVLGRLTALLETNRIDAVVTVGAGDKMFWGRLAAWCAGVPVILSALHSTGWPDSIGRLNRLLTPLTTAFIAVADEHGRYLIEREKLPSSKVCAIPNGVDLDRFSQPVDRTAIRAKLGISADAPLAGIVAALRPEKNHEMLLHAAARVRRELPDAELLVVGDGPERARLEKLTHELGLAGAVHYVGTRSDVPELLGAIDIFLLSSKIEANPVSILEAMAAGKPVIAPRVGSIPEVVADGETGYLFDAGDVAALATQWLDLAHSPERAAVMGAAGRHRVECDWSLELMVEGYESLISELYDARKLGLPPSAKRPTEAQQPPQPIEVGV